MGDFSRFLVDEEGRLIEVKGFASSDTNVKIRGQRTNSVIVDEWPMSECDDGSLVNDSKLRPVDPNDKVFQNHVPDNTQDKYEKVQESC